MRIKIKLEFIRRVSLVVALAVVAAGLMTEAIVGNAAGGAAISATANPQPSPTPPVEEEVFEVVRKIVKEEKKESTPPTPPAKEQRLVEELEIRAMFLKAQREQAKAAQERAERTTNPAERQVLLKDAQLKSETVQSMTRTIVGPPAGSQANNQPAQGSPAASPGSGSAAGGARLNLKQTWGALEQLKQSNVESTAAAESKNDAGAKARATEAFKEGRAGAGGVALYKSATMLTPLDLSKITSAQIQGDRLILNYDGRKISFPKLNPQFLAVAIRSVYGGDGLVRGTLLANEANAVVLATGKEQYGDVVWKKEFLPGLPENLKVGETMALDLGPGVGVLSLPDPSHDRVTYYGPLKGNLLGRVVQEADMVFSMYWYGVDWRTGKPLDPTKLDGFESSIEADLKQTSNPDASMTARKPAKNWWEDTVWFVWTPDEMSLQLSSAGDEFGFVKATMKCNVWGVREENVRPSSRLEGVYLTKHYDDLARAFPVLAELKEAAKAVAVVRWLKQNHVSLALDWARTYPLAAVETPDKIRRYSVHVHRDEAGKPIVEPPEQKQ